MIIMTKRIAPHVSTDSCTPPRIEGRRVRLTAVQTDVLGHIDLDARASVEEISTAAGLSSRTVRHTIERLKKLLYLSPCCWTDPYLMGETPYRIFLTIHPGTERRHASFLDFLTKIPEVHWVGTLIGYYQVGLQLRASNFEQLRRVLDSIDQSFGSMIVQKEYGIISELTFLSASPIRQKRIKTPKITFRASSTQLRLDDVDRGILEILRDRPLAPLSEVGRTLKMPTNTVAYRFKNLLDKQVILGFFFSHDERSYGLESYLILVSVVGLGSKTAEQLRRFAHEHPQVLMFTACTGRWDFEFEVVVSEVGELQRIVDGIHAAAQGEVRDILVHAWGYDFKG
jgi:DNA-binding Lrp family transcriptional regulator